MLQLKVYNVLDANNTYKMREKHFFVLIYLRPLPLVLLENIDNYIIFSIICFILTCYFAVSSKILIDNKNIDMQY